MAVAKSNPADFRKLKEIALDLLEWSLDDISPDAQHRLHAKMGIEREGHFVHPELKAIENFQDMREWESRCDERAANLAKALNVSLAQRPDLKIERIYDDDSGNFLMELTTQPISPKEAAQAATNISAAMIEKATGELGISDACFGTMNADFLKNMGKHFGLRFEHNSPSDRLAAYSAQVFEVPSADDPHTTSHVLAGRGQHANISLWCGDSNLFHGTGYIPRSNSQQELQQNLGEAVTQEAIRMLPGMILPSRHGNYLRIKADLDLAIRHIAVSYNEKADYAINWVDMRKKHEIKPAHHYTRMEFRQGASDADPYDIALAAAIPATKAFLDHVTVDKGTGKAVLDARGQPQFDFRNIAAAQIRMMPKSQEAAAAIFNQKDNPNFTFLNNLADKKIAKLEEKSRRGDQGARQEIEMLKNIGSKLHDMYCREYGMESEMKKSPVTSRAG